MGLVTHPIRTLALVFHKLAALSAGLALILALIAWFWTDHTKPDFVPCFWGSIGVIVVLLQCLFDRFGSVFPQCGLMVFPGVVIVSR